MEVVAGECSPLPRQAAEATAAVFPNARLTIVPGAGHQVWHEAPGCLAAALSRVAGPAGLSLKPGIGLQFLDFSDRGTVMTFEPPAPFVEPTGRRVRVRLGDEIVAQSDRAQLLVQYGPGGLPTYYLPETDVADGALVDEQAVGGQRTWTVQVSGKRAERAAWTHPNPSGALAKLADHVTFSWRQLEWYEEDDRVVRHARDPHHRVDTVHSSRRVQVLAGGQVLADSVRPLLLYETTLPTRYYLPFEDVRTEFFEASDATSVCPYKGRARYWSIRVGDTFIKDVAWSYPDPIPENPKVRDLVAFFQERVDIVVDGEALARPATPWSTADGVAPGDAVHRDR